MLTFKVEGQMDFPSALSIGSIAWLCLFVIGYLTFKLCTI